MQLKFLLVLASFCSITIQAAPVAIHNIQGYGFDAQRQLVEFNTLIFDEQTGQILARGSQDLLTQYRAAKAINGHGKTVLPGLGWGVKDP